VVPAGRKIGFKLLHGVAAGRKMDLSCYCFATAKRKSKILVVTVVLLLATGRKIGF
jgi:hypothetical protein